MPNLKSVMDDLRRKGNEQTRKTYERHGMPFEKTLGVSVADLKTLASCVSFISYSSPAGCSRLNLRE